MPLERVVPEWKLFPFTVMRAVSPTGTEFGLADETVGAESMVRQAEHVSATCPGSMMVMSLGPGAALLETLIFTWSDVEVLTTTELVVT
jgi:hypothetical protein